jgi:membrane peptidoglycan carboxypeptidase
MQTSRARRQPRRSNDRRRRNARSGRTAAAALPLFLFGAMALIAAIGFFGTIAVFATYNRDLPDPTELEQLEFISESVIYDRSATVELARFSAGERREEVSYEQIPAALIDATTAIEDRTFWTNTGFDPLGIASAAIDTLRGRERGASTITQQLVRQRLLDEELVRDPERLVERKIKEIIQSIRVTEAYPGVEGKQRIMAAYLNQNYYGNGSYGIKAAAQGYFGVTDLEELSLGQVALLAALPQSPSSFDLVRNAVEDDDGTLYVPLDEAIPVVARRNYILQLLADDPDRRVLTGTTYDASDFEAAQREPIRLSPQTRQQFLAPHFVYAARDELAERLCSGEPTCPALERGGLRVVSTLDWAMQQAAEKWVTAAILLPHEDDPEAVADALGVPYQDWMKNLRDANVRNGALAALDYQTGEIVAYVGSAGYYRGDIATPQFQPQFDVLGDGWRQSGSTFKIFNYATGIEERRMTAASMFMDVTTRYSTPIGPYTPTNADLLERGPLRLRQALQFSLNVPAVKALELNGVEHVFEMAQRFGIRFQDETPSARLSLTLGTEVNHPIDLLTGYGTLANRGQYIGNTHLLTVQDASGTDLLPPWEPPAGEQAVSPQAAYVVSDILAGNTNPNANPIWGEFAIRDANDNRRPAALKTGTTTDAKDLMAVGFIAPPAEAEREAGEYALAVVTWAGNSDSSVVADPANPVYSVDLAAPLWQQFLTEVTQDWAVHDFERPNGIVEADVDAWSGMRPTQWSTETVREIFLDGTVPGEDTTKRGLEVLVLPADPLDPEAEPQMFLWDPACGGVPETRGFLVLDDVERDHPEWRAAIDDWIARAKQGTNVRGGPHPDLKTRTSYFLNRGYTPYGRSWGAPFPPEQSCLIAPSPSPSESLSPSPSETPSPSPSETPTPTIEPTPTLTIEPTPTLTIEPTILPTPSLPLPTPTEEPTEEPSPT